MSVFGVKDKSKHSGERENEVALDPALIRERTLYLKFRRSFNILNSFPVSKQLLTKRSTSAPEKKSSFGRRAKEETGYETR